MTQEAIASQPEKTSAFARSYEVVDFSKLPENPEQGINLIFREDLIEPGHEMHESKVIGTYESLADGFVKNVSDEVKMRRVRKALVVTAAAAVAVTSKDIYDSVISQNSEATQADTFKIFFEPFATFVAVASVWLANDAISRARTRKEALVGAFRAGVARYRHTLSPKDTNRVNY